MITGGAPHTGYRVSLDRGPAESAPFVYRGTVTFPDATYGVVAEVSGDLSVAVTLDAPEGPARDALAEKVRLLVRQVVRQSGSGVDEHERPSRPPARKIVRWRGEK